MWFDATNFAAMTKLAVIFAAYEYLRSCFSINSLMDWGWCATGRRPIRESAKMASAGGDLNVSVWLIHLMKRRMRTRSLSRVAEATHPPERSIDRR